MTTHELRKKFLHFFTDHRHSLIASASLIPENDPTVLFTTAGMHPLVPYLMGEKHPSGTKLTDVQKCIRTGDIDEVGDAWHLTFFEMLGNWSLNDYWKSEALTWSFEFLTKHLEIPLDKLAVTVFEGDEDAPFDNESFQIWQKLGLPPERIYRYNKKENWWGPAGQTGPCGPDSEMFYITDKAACGPDCQPKCSCGKYVEIWNDVFMEYFKNSSGVFEIAKQRNVDTGMGLERVVALLNGYTDVYHVDSLWPVVQKLEEICDKTYEESESIRKSMRVIADHLRAASMIMGDDKGVGPGNVDQSYVVRKLIRRAIRHGRKLDIVQHFCVSIAQVVVKIFEDIYPEMEKNKEFIFTEMEKEEVEFGKTIEKGLREFEKLPRGNISGKDAFILFSTYGFPLEMTQELAEEKGVHVDTKIFQEEFERHQDLSRQGAEQKFKGGLADHSEESTKLHTATHLLHAALRQVLGDHVQQKGSNITPERLRFDFSHGEKMTDEQKKAVENIVNDIIQQDLPVHYEMLDLQEAKRRGAIGLFEDKYAQIGGDIKVYFVGDEAIGGTFSKEVCGGPHVEHTGVLGTFKIKKEEAVASGIRRIKAILE